jgi:hypothetical protein
MPTYGYSYLANNGFMAKDSSVNEPLVMALFYQAFFPYALPIHLSQIVDFKVNPP